MDDRIVYIARIETTMQVKILCEVTSVSAFHVQGIKFLGFPAILPSEVLFSAGDVIAVSAVAVVRTRCNKTINALV